jgi:DNA polymerase-3 subunit alpha
MEAARILAGYSLAQADLLRKIMGKKKLEAMAQEKSKFVVGCQANGIDQEHAEKLFDVIEQFASYGFNRAHAAAYAVLSYQTSYLKAHYRLEYMAAVLAQAAGDTDKTAEAINDCRTHGIEVKAPDVNVSHATHWVDGPAIRFGFDAVKKLGEKAAQAIVDERNLNGPYTSLYDLASRTLTLENRAVTKNAVQALVVCGACDGFAERARLAASVDAVCEMVRKQKAKMVKQNKNQMGLDLFAAEEGGKPPKFEPELPAPADTPPLDPIERLKWERDSLGIYVTGHPVEILAKDLRRLTDGPLSIVQPESKGKTVRVGGLVNSVRKIITKKGDPMAFVQIEDQTGRIELTVFPRTMKEFGSVFVEDTVVLIEGKVELERQRPGAEASEDDAAPKAQMIVDAAYSWQEASKLTERPRVDLNVDLVGVSEETMDLLLEAAKTHPGSDRLFLLTHANGHDIKIESELRVSADNTFLADLREAIGLNVAVESMREDGMRRESGFEVG